MAEEEVEEAGEGGGGLPEEQDCPEGAPEWMVTFGDMMSLLLTFFILLLSFSTMEVLKYRIFSGSVMQAFGVQEIIPAFQRPQADKVVAKEFSLDYQSARIFQGMQSIVEQHTARTPSGRVDVEIYEDYRGIVLEVSEDGMFEAGRADIRPAVWPFLEAVLDVALLNEATITVEAHTDNSPMRSAVFPSNDHLSAARSVSIVQYFLGRSGSRPGGPLPPERIEASAMGEHRPKMANINNANRRKNRRIELVFAESVGDHRFED
jgi:chemotaxis protein MotB